jgi:hypothetical protein
MRPRPPSRTCQPPQQLRRIVATTEHDDAASIAVMRRLAMRRERNPLPAPFYVHVVSIIEKPNRRSSPITGLYSSGVASQSRR